MALLDAQYFFYGFGFAPYMERFGWTHCALDAREERFPPKRPLLPYLEALNHKVPTKYDAHRAKQVENPDWLILETPGNNGSIST